MTGIFLYEDPSHATSKTNTKTKLAIWQSVAPSGPRRIQIAVSTLYLFTNSTSQTFNSLFRNFLGI